ncbi:MAG: hypothetical protein ABIK07_19495 [Planctomycetota bacterium]
MSRNLITAAAMILLTLNLCGPALAQKQQSVEDLQRGQITKRMGNSLRAEQIFLFHSGYLFIGDLLYGSPYVPMADNQEETIIRLDKLLLRTQLASMENDADYLDTNPRDYKEYMERSKDRHREAVKHGQFMTFTGLLTQPQSKAVIQRYFSTRKWRAFYQERMQEVIGFTEAQKTRLARAQSEYNIQTKPLFSGSMLPDANQAEIKAGLRLYEDQFRIASMAVLTPAQKTKYAQLTARQPSPDTIPSAPVPSETDRERLDLKKLSNVFRAIDQNKLNLSEKQNQFLDELYDVTRRGLLWIETADASQEDSVKHGPGDFIHTKAEFLKHAEQVALLGILTESQARLVQGQ